MLTPDSHISTLQDKQSTHNSSILGDVFISIIGMDISKLPKPSKPEHKQETVSQYC
jgi:hypothetical protein